MKWITCVLFLQIAISGCGQQSKKEIASSYIDAQALLIVNPFFEAIKTGQYKTALIELFKTNHNFDLNDSESIDLFAKFNTLNEGSGKFSSYKLLREKKINDDIGVYVYLVKYEKKYFRFTFIFYNNDKEVKLYKFSYDGAIGSELEDAIKLYVN